MQIKVTEIDRRLNIQDKNNCAGTQYENKVTTLQFVLPAKYATFNKKIVFETPDDKVVWDFLDENNTYVLKQNITKYGGVYFYLWLTDSQTEKDFRTEAEYLEFIPNSDADSQITESEISGYSKLIKILEEQITKVENLNITHTVDNKDLVITFTNKEGESTQERLPGVYAIPSGGAQGQLLAKKTATNFDFEWVDQTSLIVDHNDLNNLDYEHSGHTGFQKQLVSGQDIKTINNQSILGSGDLNLPKQIIRSNTQPTDPNVLIWIDTSRVQPSTGEPLLTADGKHFITNDGNNFIVREE